MENVKEAFLTSMIVLPLVFIFGIFGKIFTFFASDPFTKNPVFGLIKH